MMTLSTVLAISGMALATFACRYGGYWLFARIRPSRSVRVALGYVPGALFVSYVVPALVSGGPMQWIAGLATIALMLAFRDLSVAVLGGTAVAWAWWSWI